ncbi:MAG: EAL domain-containing protein [Gammaproteobacteria bacterium]|nr:EAL domain-containing protein [Gammaproteobacteria bacterium]
MAALEEQSRSLGLAAQQGSAFNSAFDQRDVGALSTLLDTQFHQYFVTASVLKLEKLFALDDFFTLVAESSEGSKNILPQEIICPNLISRAKQRHGAQRLQPLSELCLHHDRVYFAVIVPTGGLRIKGYVLVITDPTLSLKRIEPALGMPLSIRNVRDETLFQSDLWPQDTALHDNIRAEYALQSNLYEPALLIAVVSDTQALNQQLQHTRYIVMFGASLVTVCAVLLALFVFQRSTVKPLRALTAQLRLVHKDRSQLGEKVEVSGNVELTELATNFNEMTTELKTLYSSLENMAFTDPLTNLPNRTLFHDRMAQLVGLCQRTDVKFAVLMMDLDRFKEVNDTLGHQVGDLLLQQVAARLENVLRKSDTVARLGGETVARLGGDEFAAILPTIATERDAMNVAQRIQFAMERPMLVAEHSLTISISVGIVIFPIHGNEGSTLLQRADIAMYQAKHNHQGFAFYDSKQDHHSLSQLTMVSDLRKAMEKNQLLMHYQPKIDIRTGALCGAEALIRWQHPERGFMPPDNFIPVAEQSGFIVPLTGWVLNESIKECALWQQRGINIPVAVNMSVRNLHDPKIIDVILKTLRRYNLKTNALIIELTETAVMTDSNRALSILLALAEEGVKVSVDDFGTGYSSLANLKKLPVHEIKIDRSFVIDMNENNNESVIVRSTVDLAHNMNMRVTAEGVETEFTWSLLRSYGCDMAQGFFLARPMPGKDFIVWAENAQHTPAAPVGGALVNLS